MGIVPHRRDSLRATCKIRVDLDSPRASKRGSTHLIGYPGPLKFEMSSLYTANERLQVWLGVNYPNSINCEHEAVRSGSAEDAQDQNIDLYHFRELREYDCSENTHSETIRRFLPL